MSLDEVTSSPAQAFRRLRNQRHSGVCTGWSYDKNGNELSAAGQLPRTGETYNDFNQLTALTSGGTTTQYTYAGTDSSDRLTAGSTRIDQGPEGISTTTDGATSTGFFHDPAGTASA
ncbi:hypothetical protein [Streptomyces sp. NPDC046985]|uniref:hypothetical protein n=1 Tax=Streptomyces sp. NPDC046985 TaxID=3155377 RepID=UPI0033E8DC90